MGTDEVWLYDGGIASSHDRVVLCVGRKGFKQILKAASYE